MLSVHYWWWQLGWSTLSTPIVALECSSSVDTASGLQPVGGGTLTRYGRDKYDRTLRLYDHFQIFLISTRLEFTRPIFNAT